MKFHRFWFLVLVIYAVSGYAKNAQLGVLVEYPFVCPSCDPRSISVRYASDGTSILETHKRTAKPQVAPANDASVYLPGEWISGAMTGFYPGRIQHWEDEVGTNFIEVQEAPSLQDGVRYVDRRLNRADEQPGQESWSIDGVSVSIADGARDREILGLPTSHLTATLAYTRTEYDESGARTGSTRNTYTYHLWMSDGLPFSPLPFKYEPFIGNHVPPYNSGPVGARLIAALVPELIPYGGLLRAEITTDGNTTAMEALDIQDTPEPPMQKFSALPVISSDQVSQFAGPLFIASLLRADMLGTETSARVTLDGRAFNAVSAWKTNEVGDFVIVISAEDENTSLFLRRPVKGIPDPGRHETAAGISFGQLRELEKEALATHTAKFQLSGVVTNTSLPTMLTNFEAGEVTISQSAGDTIRGSVSGTVSALPTAELSRPQVIPVEISFQAPRGLENFRFRSNESRLVH